MRRGSAGEESGMKRVRETLAQLLPHVLLLAGAAAVAVGAGMIYAPAGLIVGGILAMAGAVLGEPGGDGT